LRGGLKHLSRKCADVAARISLHARSCLGFNLFFVDNRRLLVSLW